MGRLDSSQSTEAGGLKTAGPRCGGGAEGGEAPSRANRNSPKTGDYNVYNWSFGHFVLYSMFNPGSWSM